MIYVYLIQKHSEMYQFSLYFFPVLFVITTWDDFGYFIEIVIEASFLSVESLESGEKLEDGPK